MGIRRKRCFAPREQQGQSKIHKRDPWAPIRQVSVEIMNEYVGEYAYCRPGQNGYKPETLGMRHLDGKRQDEYAPHPRQEGAKSRNAFRKEVKMHRLFSFSAFAFYQSRERGFVRIQMSISTTTSPALSAFRFILLLKTRRYSYLSSLTLWTLMVTCQPPRIAFSLLTT